MKLYNTARKSQIVSVRDAVLQGLAQDKGLFMPVEIPCLPEGFFAEIEQLSFQEIAFEISKLLLGDDLAPSVLQSIVEDAFNFDVPLVDLSEQVHCLELFHGPTLAFKDFGARFMARLMSHFIQDSSTELTVLAATSGDTGSAVAHGFYKSPGINVVILYPSGKVSRIQEQQLTTIGANVRALEIEGSFDDCQRLVKDAFLDPDLKDKLTLTSANSINIARLIPQSFYYFHAYARLGEKSLPTFISVPSGNFGNLTAGLLAKKMGLPVAKFIAATNINAVVPQYLESGQFLPRTSQATISNAMDVGDPSNFTRMRELYTRVEDMRLDISAFSFSDQETRKAMAEVIQYFDYMLDPHGAVGYLGLKAYLQSANTPGNGIFLETAHPAKFLDVVEEATQQSVSVPERLRVCLEREKQAQLLPAQFSDMKELLLRSG